MGSRKTEDMELGDEVAFLAATSLTFSWERWPGSGQEQFVGGLEAGLKAVVFRGLRKNGSLGLWAPSFHPDQGATQQGTATLAHLERSDPSTQPWAGAHRLSWVCLLALFPVCGEKGKFLSKAQVPPPCTPGPICSHQPKQAFRMAHLSWTILMYRLTYLRLSRS